MLKNIHPSLELLSNVQSKWDFFSNSWRVLRISELYKSWKTIKSFHFIQIGNSLRKNDKQWKKDIKIIFPLSDKSFVISSTYMRFWKRQREYFETPSNTYELYTLWVK